MAVADSLNRYFQLTSLEWTFIALALLFFMSGLAFITSIFFSRIIKSYYHHSESRLRSAITPLLTSVVVNEDTADTGIQGAMVGSQYDELRKIVGTSGFAKDVLIQQLISAKKNLTGRSALTLIQTYYRLGLEVVSLKKLSNPRWNVKAQGIRELAEMQSFKSVSRIAGYLRSRNQTLREESVMALVRLEENNPFFFLDQYEIPLTPWMRLNIFHHLQKIDQRRLPSFSRWFRHSNKSVVLFSLSMARQFRQRDAIPHLVDMLNTTTDYDTLTLVIDTLGELDAYECADLLASCADRHSEKQVLSEIANALGKIGTEQHVIKLQKLLTHREHMVRFETLKAIRKLDAKAFESISRMNDQNLIGTIKHLEEPLLQ